MKKQLVFLFLLLGFILHAQEVVLNGIITDLETGEKISNTVVELVGTKATTKTDDNGKYTLKVNKGDYTLQIYHPEYHILQIPITINNNFTQNAALRSLFATLDEVVIDGTATKSNIEKPEMSVNKLTAAEVKQIPVVMGEPDLINALLQLPGVTNSGEGSSGFNVRGGGSDQNLILVDQAPLYNSSHLYGFFSAFNTDAIRDIKLYKGGIPARFGGRGSSVLDINQRSGSDKQFKGNGGIGLLSSRLLLEGPIKKDKTSFLVAARASYAHLFLKFSKKNKKNAVYFYDLNAKINHKLNKNNTLSLTTYYGRDYFKFSKSFVNDYGNTLVNVNWDSKFSENMKSKMALIYSDYIYNININSVGFNWKSGITNFTYKWDLENYLSDDVIMKYGINTTYYNFNPGVIKPDGDKSKINYYNIPDKKALENAVYAELEHSIFDKFKVNYGLRWSSFFRLGPQEVSLYNNNEAVVYDPVTGTYSEADAVGTKQYKSNQIIDQFNYLEPRAAISYIIDDNKSVKASYNRMVQYIHLISNTSAATPLDIWAPSGNYIKPQLIDQYALGYFTNLKNNRFSLEIETYYKTGKNRLDYIDGANLIGNENIERVLLNGHTRAYGLEVLFRKNTGRLTGWVAYTIAKSEQQTKGRNNLEPGINNGKWYRTPQDRLHDLSIVANYQLNEKWALNANFVLQSGRPITYPIGKYELQDLVIPRYGERNKNSLPLFHHLDIAATYTPDNNNKKFQSEWVFGIYNLYNRKNAATIYFQENGELNKKTEAVQLSIFGIIPSVTYNFKF